MPSQPAGCGRKAPLATARRTSRRTEGEFLVPGRICFEPRWAQLQLDFAQRTFTAARSHRDVGDLGIRGVSAVTSSWSSVVQWSSHKQ